MTTHRLEAVWTHATEIATTATSALVVPVRIVHFLCTTAQAMVIAIRVILEVARAKALVIGATASAATRRTNAAAITR